MFLLDFMENKFHSNLWRVSSFYEHSGTLSEGRLSIPTRILFRRRKSSFRGGMRRTCRCTSQLVASTHFRETFYCRLDAYPLVGTQRRELKTVLCPQTPGDFRRNAEPA